MDRQGSVRRHEQRPPPRGSLGRRAQVGRVADRPHASPHGLQPSALAQLRRQGVEARPEAGDADDRRREDSDGVLPRGPPPPSVQLPRVHQLAAQRRRRARHLDARGARASPRAAQGGVGRLDRPRGHGPHLLRLLCLAGSGAPPHRDLHGRDAPALPALLRRQPRALLLHDGPLAGGVEPAEQGVHHQAAARLVGGEQEGRSAAAAAAHP
mmetsp:Transcript_28483/g.75412  ORF Transcript_28483/g.75412 Transcript_28483/m.75412 type:complete len:211 (+) Transcript_28483:1613-2245(+)